MRTTVTGRRRRLRPGRVLLAAAVGLALLAAVLAALIALGRALFGRPAQPPAADSASDSSIQSQLPAQSSSLAGSSDGGADYESVPSEGTASGSLPAVDLGRWELLLANAAHPLPADYSVTTATLENGLPVDERIYPALQSMIDDAAVQGVDLWVCSAYRSVERQTQLYEAKVQEYVAAGYARADAEAVAATIVAIPGTSEHNTGLAVDIVTPEYQTLDAGYADTAAAIWLRDNAPDYGFILRYPADKEGQTGIIFEPWHYRYVGEEYARTITDSGLCLEEWLAQQAAAQEG